MKSISLTFLFILFFLVEANARQERINFVQVNQIGQEFSEKQELLFSGLRVIRSNDNGSKILVADVSDNTIRIFDSNGEFLTKIGRRGRGPGEFQQVTSFEVLDNQVIVVLDRFLNRISYFDSTGSLQKTISIRNQVPVGSSILSFKRELDSSHFILYRDFRKNGNNFLLHHFDAEFKIKKNGFINVFKYFYDLNIPMEVQISQRPAYLGSKFGDDKIAFVADTYTGTLAIFDEITFKETLIGKPIKDYVKKYDWDLRKKYRASGETGFASSSNQQGKFFYKQKGSNFSLVGNSKLLLQFYGMYVDEKVIPYLNIYGKNGNLITTLSLEDYPISFINDRNQFSIVPHFLDENNNPYVSDYEYKGIFPAVRVLKTNLEVFLDN